MRKNFLRENRFTQYFLYTIGEILLVVVGILLALQINDWNQQQKDKVEEKKILADLHREFSINKEKLQKLQKRYKETKRASLQLMVLMGESPLVLQEYNLDSLIERTVNYGVNYRPSENVLSDVLSSGKLKLISSETLKRLLFEWSSELKAKDESHHGVDKIVLDYLNPYLSRRTSFKNVDAYGRLAWEDSSRFENDTFEIFQELEFENHLNKHAFSIDLFTASLETLSEIIDQILAETKPTLTL